MDSAIGHEYQMIDDERHPDAKIGPHRQTAAFYDVLPVSVAPPALRNQKPAGEWNVSKVRVDMCRSQAATTRRALPERTRVLEYELDCPAPRGDREEQVQGRRALRQAAERPHPAPGSRRQRVVPQHQDSAPGGSEGHGSQAPQPTGTSGMTPAQEKACRSSPNEAGARVDVTIDGKPFTSYI